jgi:DNA helicase-2/ATP-dependent DNA helicase PcrA
MTWEELLAIISPPGKELDEEKLEAIQHVHGPLLVVAGPGSGKTKTLISRTLNLLLVEDASSGKKRTHPSKILLCTFTEKAARELRDRLNRELGACGSKDVDIHEMTIGTIHSVCQGIIDEYPNEAGVGVYSKTKGLGRGYTVLDDLTRNFFMMDHFEAIFGDKIGEKYLGMWQGYWTTIKRAQEYFDKITEELVDLDALTSSSDETVRRIGNAMKVYRSLMIQEGKVDFAHLEWLAFDLLDRHEGARNEFQSKFEYVMVDEYQDTNYIQEQLIFRLANADRNIAVVGDVDQSIYRFRGATTQNLMEFPTRVGKPDLAPVSLGLNYRSSQQVIDLYQDYRDEINWLGCRWDLDVSAAPDMEKGRPKYPALIKIDEEDAEAEATKVADLILTLKKDGVISDYNQVAILLYSVREGHSGHYIRAIRKLKEQGEDIDFYAPRARTYFERPEIMCVLAGMRAICRVNMSDSPAGYPGQEAESLKGYMDRCVAHFRSLPESKEKAGFIAQIKAMSGEIADLTNTGGKPKHRFLDYFYGVITTPLMSEFLDQELPARHLAQLSNLIQVFCDYYDYEWVGGLNASKIWEKFFNSFLRKLFQDGINEYEDQEESFPSGAVQFLTYHQSKGLEFPVIIVGDLHAQITSSKQVDDKLGDHYHRKPHEPRKQITEFDKRRLYYVAFSRAKDFLVLSGHNDLTDTIGKRKGHVDASLATSKPWDEVKADGSYRSMKCKELGSEKLKPVLGFTSHINAYERCPHQFQLQKQYGFVPVRSEQLWMGNVVHNTLQDVHDHVLKKKEGEINSALIKDYFDKNNESLRRQGVEAPKPRPGEKTSLEELAVKSVERYVDSNREKLKHTRWSEKEILIDSDDYSLTGVIDLLFHDDEDYVELLDFKVGQRKNNEKYRESYQDQIRLYCNQVEPKIGKKPDEAYLYWVTEPDDKAVKDPVPTDDKLLEATKKRVEDAARNIIAKKFSKLPKRNDDVCGICEFDRKCWGCGS